MHNYFKNKTNCSFLNKNEFESYYSNFLELLILFNFKMTKINSYNITVI